MLGIVGQDHDNNLIKIQLRIVFTPPEDPVLLI